MVSFSKVPKVNCKEGHARASLSEMDVSVYAPEARLADFLLQLDEITRMPRTVTNSTNLNVFVAYIVVKLIRHSRFIGPQLVHIR